MQFFLYNTEQRQCFERITLRSTLNSVDGRMFFSIHPVVVIKQVCLFNVVLDICIALRPLFYATVIE